MRRLVQKTTRLGQEPDLEEFVDPSPTHLLVVLDECSCCQDLVDRRPPLRLEVVSAVNFVARVNY